MGFLTARGVRWLGVLLAATATPRTSTCSRLHGRAAAGRCLNLSELAATVLRDGHTLRVRARGESMLPFLRHGDVLHVRPLPAAAVRVGDVICYAPSPETLHLHRVIARDERGFVTRGDALPYVEDVPAASLLGRVIARERGGRLRRLDDPAAARRARLIVAAAPLLARLLPVARAAYRAWRRGRRA